MDTDIWLSCKKKSKKEVFSPLSLSLVLQIIFYAQRRKGCQKGIYSGRRRESKLCTHLAMRP